MTASIRVLPSGRTFTAESKETILEAALRAGLSLTYSCNNGSCGECKARVLEGEVGEVRFHDYCFTDAEKALGFQLLCSCTAGSDLVIEAREADRVEDIPHQQVVTRVSRVERVSDDVITVHVRTPRNQTLRFLAGQHVTLEIPGMAPRNKSIASCPCNAMQLQFHVRRVPGDEFSEYVFTKLAANQSITLMGPYGSFTLDEDAARPVIFLAYDTGIAPIKSLIEHAISLDFAPAMHLYWVVHRAGGHYLNNLCRSWVDALDNFTYAPLVGEYDTTREDGAYSVPERNLVSAARHLVGIHRNLRSYDVYANGPAGILDPARRLLLEHGLPEAQLHIDYLRRF